MEKTDTTKQARAERTASLDAATAYNEAGKRHAAAREQMEMLRGAALQNPALLQDPTFASDWDAAQDEVETAGTAMQSLQPRLPQGRIGAHAPPGAAITLPTPEESQQRANSAEEDIGVGRALADKGKKGGLFSLITAGFLQAAKGAREKLAATRNAKAADEAGVAQKKQAQSKANVESLTPAAQRALQARVPQDIVASILGSVASGQANPMQAMRALDAEMKRVASANPETMGDVERNKAIAKEEAEASAKTVTGQETDAQKSRREIAQKVEAKEAGKKQQAEKYDREAIERFEKELDGWDETNKRPLPPRLDRLSLPDAKRILRLENVSPAVRDLAKQRVGMEPASETAIGDYSGVEGSANVPEPAATKREKYELVDGKWKKVG